MADTAVVTTVTSAAYVDLGALPVVVENNGNTLVYYRIAASQPAVSGVGGVGHSGHKLFPDHTYPRDGSITLNPWTGDTRHVWAIAHPDPTGATTTTASLIVTGAP
jgi:hypothetical protein